MTDLCDWHSLVDAFLDSKRVRVAASTVDFYEIRLKQIVPWMIAHRITPQAIKKRDVDAYLSERATLVSESTNYKDVIVLNAILGFGVEEGYLDAHPLYRYRIRKPAPASVYKPTLEDLQTLMSAIEQRWDIRLNPHARFQTPRQRRFYKAREQAVLALMIDSGARIGEILALRMEDYDKAGKQLIFRITKGRKPRTVPISASSLEMVGRWLKERPESCPTDYLFVTNVGDRLAVLSYDRIFARYIAFAGVHKFTLHCVRHYAATELAKHNLWVAMTILGHKDPKTTMRYAHADADHVRAVHAEVDTLGKILVEKRAAKKARKRVI